MVNVDVSNACFWHEARFDHLAFLISTRDNQTLFLSDMYPKEGETEPGLFKALRRLAKNKFYVKHRGQTNGELLAFLAFTNRLTLN